MKTLLAALALTIAMPAIAETITITGTVVGQGGSESYSNIPNDAGYTPMSIVKNPTYGYATVTLGGVTCRGYYNVEFALKCSDGFVAQMNLLESYVRRCNAGRCNAHWELTGGTIDRVVPQ